MSPAEIHNGIHEIGHVIFTSIKEENIVDTGLEIILTEGVNELVALRTLVLENLKTVNEVSDFVSKCGEFVVEHKSVLLDVIENPKKYDGLALPALDVGFGPMSVVHAAGIFFVGKVMENEDISTWPMLWKYPPNIDEVFNPFLYIIRVGDKLTNNKNEKVLPREIEIKKSIESRRII